MTTKLSKIEIDTEFRWNGRTYRKTMTGQGNKTKCVPKAGGQFQVELAVFIDNNASVDVTEE